MTDSFIDVENLQWQTRPIHRQGETRVYDYELELFEPLANWDVWDYWEKERIQSMQAHIKQGDLVWDVGAEQGWMSALIAKYMSDNIVLFEPTGEFWPGIKAIWEKNGLKKPKGTFCGFLSDHTTTGSKLALGWCDEANEASVIEKRKYRNVFDEGDQEIVPSVKGDNIYLTPDHITIDVEGAELLVLKGLEQTLREHLPKVWVSIHPDMMVRDYGQDKSDLLFFMDDCGYEAELLAVDHEEHWIFTSKVTK